MIGLTHLVKEIKIAVLTFIPNKAQLKRSQEHVQRKPIVSEDNLQE